MLVIKRLARDLDVPVEIIGCETVREHDGLALSSRNLYLSADERRTAGQLNIVLRQAIERLRAGVSIGEVEVEAARQLMAAGFTCVDYVAVRDGESLQAIADLSRPARILAAAWLGKTRLIDNFAV